MAATYTKPSKPPEWADSPSGNLTEPSQAIKDAGHVVNSIPSSAYENWRTNLVGLWFKWIDERFVDGTSSDSFEIKDPGTGVTAIDLTSDEGIFYSMFSQFAKGIYVYGDTSKGIDAKGRGLRAEGVANVADADGTASAEGIFAKGGSSNVLAKIAGTGAYIVGGTHSALGKAGRGLVVEGGTSSGTHNATMRLVPQALPSSDLKDGDLIYNEDTDKFMGVENGTYFDLNNRARIPILYDNNSNDFLLSQSHHTFISQASRVVILPITDIDDGKEFIIKNAIGNSSANDVDVTIAGTGINFDDGANQGDTRVLTKDGDTIHVQWDYTKQTYWTLSVSETGATGNPD